jgi:hypothetical protein
MLKTESTTKQSQPQNRVNHLIEKYDAQKVAAPCTHFAPGNGTGVCKIIAH